MIESKQFRLVKANVWILIEIFKGVFYFLPFSTFKNIQIWCNSMDSVLLWPLFNYILVMLTFTRTPNSFDLIIFSINRIVIQTNMNAFSILKMRI